MVVQKYGGTSLSTIESMRNVARRITHTIRQSGPIVIVVSAMGHTTDQLHSLAMKASSNPSAREMDMLLATGEQVSSSLLTMMIRDQGLDAVALNGTQAGIQTEGAYSKNKIKAVDVQTIKDHLTNNRSVIVTGFQGVNSTGDITTLGRGGSDTSAVALSAMLDVPCEIFTDVEGIYSIDPRRYTAAQKLPTITYEEMSELASLGANVLEARAVELAQKYTVPLTVAHAHTHRSGTTIKEHSTMLEQRTVTGVSVVDDIVLVSIENVSAPHQTIPKLFNALSHRDINVDMISHSYTSENGLNISFSSKTEDFPALKDALEDFRHHQPRITVHFDETLSKLSVVGIGMRTQSGVAAELFSLLGAQNIPFKLVTTSDISISYAIPKACANDAAVVIAEAFGL